MQQSVDEPLRQSYRNRLLSIQEEQTSGAKIPGVEALMYPLRNNEYICVITGFYVESLKRWMVEC